jgi:peptidoglycan/xylan/chitin deacetylase (PgdA/CDA1 family)
MSQVVTNAGEALFAQKAQANEQLDIDTFIFAYVPGQDSQAPVDRSEGLPPTAQQVHTQTVQQVGRINNNTVVYSTVLNSLTGPFEFNWVGLYSSVNNTLVAISHVKSVNKTITELGNAGNTLNRNFAIEYSGISDITGITVAPETWQLDFSARLAGMDALTQNLAMDMNGRNWFIDDGFKVEPTANDKFRVIAGVGYVHGMRIELAQDYVFDVQSYSKNVYVDVWFEGDASSKWETKYNIVVSYQAKNNYIDEQGQLHILLKIAVVASIKNVDDFRVKKDVASKEFVSSKLVDTPSISFIFDDGKSNHIAVAEQFTMRGFRAGFAINAPNYIDYEGRLTRVEIRSLYDQGHEILNHGATHMRMSELEHDPALIRAEVDTCYDALSALGIPIYGFVAPYSVVHKDYHNILSERHAYACTIYGPEDGTIDIRKNPMRLSRYNIDGGNINDFKDKIDEIIRDKKHLCVYGHDVLDDDSLTPIILGEMLDYCLEKVELGYLDVMTTAQQVKKIVGASNHSYIQIGEVIESGVSNWRPSNSELINISAVDEEKLNAYAYSSSSIVWPIFHDDYYKTDNQPVTFSVDLSSNNKMMSVGIHFYDKEGERIIGSSYETGSFKVDSKSRRYSISATIPTNADQVRPYLRMEEECYLTLEKPRLKIGNDRSGLGKKKVSNTEVFNVYRDKLTLPAQTFLTDSVNNELLLPNHENEYFHVINSKEIIAQKSIQIALNLYSFWPSTESTPDGTGIIFINNEDANPSRHAGGIIHTSSVAGGFMNLSTTLNLEKGKIVKIDVIHNSTGNISLIGGDAKSALDVLVLKEFK